MAGIGFGGFNNPYLPKATTLKANTNAPLAKATLNNQTNRQNVHAKNYTEVADLLTQGVSPITYTDRWGNIKTITIRGNCYGLSRGQGTDPYRNIGELLEIVRRQIKDCC
jgi:hypothetical protein